MKKSILLFTVLIVSFCSLNAQLKQIAEGPVFEEPEEGFARILQMKDGSTLFFHVTFKRGIHVRIYDNNHKEKATNTFEPSYGKLKGGAIEGIFEIGGNAVLLISEVDGRVPVLYRLVVDGGTGQLKDEQKIAELQKITMGMGYAMAYGGVALPDFNVRKDPNSDNYAVVMFNSFESDRNKRIEIILFGADHKEAARAFYASPDEKYKYMSYIDMAVMGADKVCVLAYGYNTRRSGGDASELIMATLNKGSNNVAFTELKFSHDLKVGWGISRYNPVTKKIVLLAATQDKESKSNAYEPYLAIIDPVTNKIDKKQKLIQTDAVLEKSVAMFGNKGAFNGLPQNLFINSDGSFTIVSEEMEIQVVSNTASTELGNIAITNYSAEGQELKSYFIPKRQYINKTALNPFYLSRREGTAQELSQGNQFKSFAYLNGTTKNYILFNDIEENEEKAAKGKLTRIMGVGECDGFYYPLANDVLPKRDLLFGATSGKRDHNLALFAISDYDSQKGIYITLKLEKEGRDKGVKIVWLQPN